MFVINIWGEATESGFRNVIAVNGKSWPHTERIAAATGSEHDAKHAMVECLGETVWNAQRAGGAPDEQAYLECLARR